MKSGPWQSMAGRGLARRPVAPSGRRALLVVVHVKLPAPAGTGRNRPLADPKQATVATKLIGAC